MKTRFGFVSNSSSTSFVIKDYTKLDDYGKKFFAGLFRFLRTTEDGWEISIEGNQISAFTNGCDNSLVNCLITAQNFDDNVFVMGENDLIRDLHDEEIANLLQSGGSDEEE